MHIHPGQCKPLLNKSGHWALMKWHLCTLYSPSNLSVAIVDAPHASDLPGKSIELLQRLT